MFGFFSGCGPSHPVREIPVARPAKVRVRIVFCKKYFILYFLIGVIYFQVDVSQFLKFFL